ncbi:transporter [Geomonas subterranea]|uniref:Transporter n=1 Tax=Geomonas subterranea TaxID=2847989 RepID=A0ABX8LKG3_9BACT|nr:transporter [Geomonas subterranea]QXE91984.1 transporter [Geomonas subterranea]QXM09923.1 transporter [Geomonas subterranea]
MIKKGICCNAVGGLLLAGSLLVPGWARAEGPALSATLGFEFASGDYGTGVTTRSIYLPVTVSVAATERLGFSLEIPYVYQSNSAVNTGVLLGSGGQMAGMQKETAAMSGQHGGSGSMSSAKPGSYSRSARGLGDVTAKAGYVLVPEGDIMPRIRPYLFVKFPTGDESRALGTGAFDQGGAVEFFKQVERWYSFVETGYTVQGHSPVLPLKDYFSFNAGTGYAITETLLPMVVLKTSTAPIEGASALVDTRIKLKYLVTGRTSIEGYLAKGWTRSSADYGSGLAVSYDF